MKLNEAFDMLSRVRCILDHQDYVNIWGKHLGNHIWFQEGTDLLRIWRSGLTHKQKIALVNYIPNKLNEVDNNEIRKRQKAM